ncbi:LysE family translocator [Sporolactobacillus pectinivorans]|uniref:LysE family translocator n=1 Tax=Sporolactobacillus pectinivorans TaxID=1591408 RepID=UPI000C26860B|nr:LysE family translocator [Sporolactobacillus pectinivorans]
MDFPFFIKGLAVGLAIAAPVGPIGVLCIRRTLAEGRMSGLLSGIGAATADAFYGSIAGFGLTAISAFLTGQSAWLRFAGGCFLCYLGLVTLLSKPADKPADSRRSGGRFAAYASTLLLTITNPMTILSFVSIFAGIGLSDGNGGTLSSLLLVAGVFCGSASWWFLLSVLVGMLREKMDRRALTWINRLSGLVIIGFGTGALYPFLI